jgi:hypothetical protein
MDAQGFNPELQQLLQQYGPDIPSAVAAAPDAELQSVSPRYREARLTMDEGAVKRMMLGGASGAAPAADGSRLAMLAQMLEIATEPGLRELLEGELAAEKAIQEHLQLIEMAEQAGDDELADQIAARLRALFDLQDDDHALEMTDDLSALPPDPAVGVADVEELPAPGAGVSEGSPQQTVGAEHPSTAAPDAAALANKLSEAWGAS